MTDEELQAMRERAEVATPGPWVTDDIERWFVFETTFNGEIAEALIRVKRAADAAFIAHAREDIPALLAEVERLRTKNTKLLGYQNALAIILQSFPDVREVIEEVVASFEAEAKE